MTYQYDLSGLWNFRLDNEKKGMDAHYETGAYSDTILLPSTTSEQKKGAPNPAAETGCLTAAYLTEGYAWYQRTLAIAPGAVGQHAVLTLERTRISHVWVDGVYAGTENSLCTPHRYDLTALIKQEHPVLTIMTSNVDYPTRGGHMTSPDTQTNWNGIVGSMTLTFYDTMRIRHVRIDTDYDQRVLSGTVLIDNYCELNNATLTVKALPVTLENLSVPDCGSDACGLDTLLPAGQVLADPSAVTLLRGNAAAFHAQSSDPHTFRTKLRFHAPLPDTLPVWDEYEPAVLRLAVSLTIEDGAGDCNDGFHNDCNGSCHGDCNSNRRGDCYAVWCGIRKFEARGTHFYINDRKTFLRGKHDGMIFPLTGYAPMNLSGWLKVMQAAKEFGINHYRCHTCCPPEAAFLAADLLGIYYEPELPFWGTFAAEGDDGYDEAGQRYLTEEGFRILDEFGNHPSFCMMSMGNELWGSPEAVNELVGRYKACDGRHLYTQGSNNFQWIPNIQPNDDFFCGVRFTVDRQIRGSYAMCDKPLGHVQTDRPCTDFTYESAIFPDYHGNSAAVGEDGTIEIQYGTGIKRVKLTEAAKELIPNVPVVSHEIGQYETYPDFDEIKKYTGVLQARNFEIFRRRLEEKGLLPMAKDYFKNSGALAAACYKDELETALRTKDMAGFQILDIQDFSGQGTALVGMLDAFMENKGILSAEEFRCFCSDAVIQAEFPSYVLSNGSALTGMLSLTWYRKELPESVSVELLFTDASDGNLIFRQLLEGPAGISENGYTRLCPFSIALPASGHPEHYLLQIRLAGTDVENHYELWSYPDYADTISSAEKSTGTVPESVEASHNVSIPGGLGMTSESLFGLHNITITLSDAITRVQKGKPTVLCLSPEQNPNAVTGTYCTDFWCYPMFRSISEGMKKEVPVGTMGLLIRREHPALALFPTNSYSTPQWWEIVMNSASTILDDTAIVPVVQTMDNFERNHRLGLIYEVQLIGTDVPLIICASPLPRLAADGHAEAACLLKSLCHYADTWNENTPHPIDTMSEAALRALFESPREADAEPCADPC
ncbi:MAG: beta-glucuronidase [Clostridium sp.]|nr:beta-glucuronidase [Clostridium sp.]